MYREFFGLQDKPFNNTPDPAFFFFSADHRQAMVTVNEGISSRCGLVLLLGEIGTGKTTICYHIQSHGDHTSAYINNPFLTEVEFLEKVNRELGIPIGDQSRKALTDDLLDYLLQKYRSGEPVILIIDEAHRLGLPILDQVLTLSNLQVADAQLLQIILVGQPELLETLRHPRLRSLNQRIGVRCHLGSMNCADTKDYINFRLVKAGLTARSPFSRQALDLTWRATGGTPRLINQLCERALHEAYQIGKKRIGRRLVKQVIKHPLYRALFSTKVRYWSMRTAVTGSIAALSVGLVLSFWYFGLHGKFMKDGTQRIGYSTAQVETFTKKPIPMSELASEGLNEPAKPAPVEKFETMPVVATDHVAQPQAEIQVSSTRVGTEAPGKPAESSRPQASNRVMPAVPSMPTPAVSPANPVGRSMPSRTQAAVDADLSGLQLSAIAWDEDPARCIAVVNNRIVHEGDFLGEARVLRIKPDHIVLIYGNEHVIKGIHTTERDPSPKSDPGPDVGDEQNNEIEKIINQNNMEQGLADGSYRSIIRFGYNTSELASEAYEELDRLFLLAKQSPNYEIFVFGYTDNGGSFEYNKRLSESRASMVGSYLVQKGINPARVKAIGMGDKHPLMPNATPEGRAANRRVEIELVPAEDLSGLLPGG